MTSLRIQTPRIDGRNIPHFLGQRIESGKVPFRHIWILTVWSIRRSTYPIASMYGIFTYIYHNNQANVGKYTIHGCYGYSFLGFVVVWVPWRIVPWQKYH